MYMKEAGPRTLLSNCQQTIAKIQCWEDYDAKGWMIWERIRPRYLEWRVTESVTPNLSHDLTSVATLGAILLSIYGLHHHVSPLDSLLSHDSWQVMSPARCLIAFEPYLFTSWHQRPQTITSRVAVFIGELEPLSRTTLEHPQFSDIVVSFLSSLNLIHQHIVAYTRYNAVKQEESTIFMMSTICVIRPRKPNREESYVYISDSEQF